MYSLIKEQSGFTIVEVLVAIVLIVLLAIIFLPVFGTTVGNIFFHGEADRAMTLASDKMEEAYTRQPFSYPDYDGLKDLLEEKNGNYVDDIDELYDYDEKPADKDFNFAIEPSTPIDVDGDEYTAVVGYELTIVVFYDQGDDYEKLTSFVRGEPDD